LSTLHRRKLSEAMSLHCIHNGSEYNMYTQVEKEKLPQTVVVLDWVEVEVEVVSHYVSLKCNVDTVRNDVRLTTS